MVVILSETDIFSEGTPENTLFKSDSNISVFISSSIALNPTSGKSMISFVTRKATIIDF